jgi:murein DD-endopeptidase MepM/ murein hydrolase activator NlpD
MYLSGNFGEIRPDHFHSGIDIKTKGVIGHQVFSVESGYVSRIKVQANGYGKSIYITHPN